MKFTYLIQQLIKQSAQYRSATLFREYRGGGITILGTKTSGEGEAAPCEARAGGHSPPSVYMLYALIRFFTCVFFYIYTWFISLCLQL